MSIKSDIIEYFRANPNHSLKPKKLARQMRIPAHQYTHFKRALKELLAEGQLFRSSKRKISIGQKRRTLTGEIEIKSQGYGFLLMEKDKEDIYIAENNVGHALNGDRVIVEIVKSRRGRIEGRVVEVVKRARKKMVGTYYSGRKTGRFIPDDTRVKREIIIPLDKNGNASDSDKVVIRLDTWDDGAMAPTGQVLEILGKPDDPGVDILSIARSFDLDSSFSTKVVQEVHDIQRSIPASEVKRRLDYRNEICFTIDPVDAKDFDDAVSLINLENGHLLLGVHIADVSHYVRPGMKSNAEAMRRGTSVYLVDRVIPMLPEDLSNDLCSLNPGEDKLCFTVLMELDKNADIVKYDIRESLIHSSKRFTYEDIQKIIDGKKRSGKFTPIIEQMFRLSKKLIRKRNTRGGLDFGSNEVRIEMDDDGIPVRIERKDRLDSHRLVEEFMLLANTTVAEHIANVVNVEMKRPVPFPYRNHEKPGGDKLKDFMRFLKAMGISFTFGKDVAPKQFQKLKQQVKGTEKMIILEEVMVRTMMKARYDTVNLGHFGLALANYCHFTSPIRRYPDLICHRILKRYLKDPPEQTISEKELKKICETSTEREIIAMEAERTSVRSKKLQYMEKHVGEVFDGVISGVVQFGLFVELVDTLVEGLVHVTGLPGDFYFFDEKSYSLRGEKSGGKYQLGDPVKIRVLRVNREQNLIDFELAD